MSRESILIHQMNSNATMQPDTSCFSFAFSHGIPYSNFQSVICDTLFGNFLSYFHIKDLKIWTCCRHFKITHFILGLFEYLSVSFLSNGSLTFQYFDLAYEGRYVSYTVDQLYQMCNALKGWHRLLNVRIPLLDTVMKD